MVSNVGSTPSFLSADLSAQRQALFQKADANGSGGLSLEEFKSIGPKDADASNGAPSASDIFSKIDADGNGEVTQTELEADAKKNFENRLQNGGMVSGDNLVQLSSSDFTQSFLSKLDEDGNGSLNLEEFAAGKPADAPSDGPSSEDIFAQLDTDGDGSLTASELESGMAQGGPPAGGPPPGGPPPGGGGGGDVSSLLESTDSTQSSASASSSSSSSSDDDEDYDALDTNKDGVVSASEKAAGALGTINSLLNQTLGVLLNAQEELFASA